MTQMVFDSSDQVLSTLRKLAKAFDDEGTVCEATKSPEFIPGLKAVEAAVRGQGLISPNETFSEVNEELIPVLQLPFYLGNAYQNSQTGSRTENLRLAEVYYMTFLELMQHFDLLPGDLEKVREAYAQTRKYDMQREEKIKLYKDEKALKERQSLAENKQEVREALRLGLVRNCYKAVNGLMYLPQELELLAYKHKLETDPQVREEYERAKNKPVEPLKFWKIDSPEAEAKCGHVHSHDIQQPKEKSLTGFAHNGSLGLPPVQTTNVNTVMEQKQLVLDRLNQVGWAQPTITLDQHDDMEYNLMMAKQARQQEAKRLRDEEKAKFGIEDSSDSENEAVSEAKTYKDRAWDDWKDANEKGSGNRNGR